MPAAISALIILAAAVLPDGANAAIPNGWVAKITVPYQSGQTFDPTKLLFTVSDPGFDDTGTPTTRTRNFTGGEIVRKQYTAHTQRLSAQVSTNLEVYVSLDDWIYAGSTVTCIAGTGYYGPSAIGGVSGVSNTSTVPYEKALFCWLNRQHERAGSGIFNVEGAPYHRHAMLGRQVACIKYDAIDASAHTTPTVTVSTSSLSDLQTGGNRVEAYKAPLNLAALNQGEIGQVNARVYPFIGDAASVLDLSTDGVAWATGTAATQTKLRFKIDKTGAYGGALAYVKAGASGGAVSAVAATARATPFPTHLAAETAVVAWNNANKGHADTGGATIRFMDTAGAAQDHNPGDTNNLASGDCWCRLEADPLNAAAVRLKLAATWYIRDKTEVGLPVTTAGAFWITAEYSAAPRMVSFESIPVDLAAFTGSVPFFYKCALLYDRNCTWSNVAGALPWRFYSGADLQQPALILGTTIASAYDQDLAIYAFLGNNFSRVQVTEHAYTAAGNASSDGLVCANNIMLKLGVQTFLGHAYDIVRGIAVVQNVFERATSAGTGPVFGIGGDNAVKNLKNVVMQHVTIPGVGTGASIGGTRDDAGCRVNFGYLDVDGSVGVQKRIAQAYNLLNQGNTKTDTFATTIYAGAPSVATGRTGNWPILYWVGYRGVVWIGGDTSGGVGPSADGLNWCAMRIPPGNAVAVGAVGFVDNQTPAAGAGNGGGNYRLTGAANPAYNRVPAGLAVLAYDLSSLARRNDGTGAAGAYETTQGVVALTRRTMSLLGVG